MRVLINVLVIFSLPFFISDRISDAGHATVESYCNTRFNYCLDYPPNVFDGIVESDNDDGIVLISQKYGLKMSVAGSHNTMQWTFRDLYEMQKYDLADAYEDVHVVGSVFADSYYEAEFRADGHLLYTKIYRFDSKLVTLELTTAENVNPEIYERLKEQLLILENV